MASFAKTTNGFSITLSDKEAKELDLEVGKTYDFLKARKGLYVMMDNRLFEDEFFRAIDDKILSMLDQSPIQDRVEEKFEKMLNHFELSRFNQLLKDGKIEKFKASEKYKKSVYKRNEEKQQAAQAASAEKAGKQQAQGQATTAAKQQIPSTAARQQVQSFSETARTMKKDSFITVRTEQQARELNDKFWKELKDGRMKGIKDFDNSYYLIDTELLREKEGRILSAIKESKTANVEDLAAKTQSIPDLIRGVCAFLKEDGELLEKKKGVYIYIP